MRGRTISDADRARARAKRMMMEMEAEKRVTEMLNKGGRNISDSDRARARDLEKSLTLNDGGMAMKTRVF